MKTDIIYKNSTLHLKYDFVFNIECGIVIDSKLVKFFINKAVNFNNSFVNIFFKKKKNTLKYFAEVKKVKIKKNFYNFKLLLNKTEFQRINRKMVKKKIGLFVSEVIFKSSCHKIKLILKGGIRKNFKKTKLEAGLNRKNRKKSIIIKLNE